jgi:HAD superfamily hydrolase (TIGR01549 family)
MSEVSFSRFAVFAFDVGGTLITFDSERRTEAYIARAAQCGVEVSFDRAQAVLAELDREIPERARGVPLSLLPRPKQRAFWMDLWAEGFRRMGVDETHSRAYADELLDPANGGNFQAVYDDVVPTLEGLRAAGRRLGVISNFSDNCESLLGELAIAEYFDFFVVSGILGVEKPDRRIFEAGIAASGRSRSDMVYVGDSIYHDIEGATSAGIQAVLIDRTSHHREFTGRRIASLLELLS